MWQSQKSGLLWDAMASVALLIGVYILGYRADQQNFYGILLGYGLAFTGYLRFAYRTLKFEKNQILYGLFLALVLRLLLLPSFPLLSDDIYRFYWDGYLVLHEINPYGYLPSELMLSPQSTLLPQEIYTSLNSPDYYSVYPPLNQFLFSLGVWISGENIDLFAAILRVFLISAEMLTIYLGIRILGLLRLRAERIFLYALNPLIITELTGNLHFEALVVCMIAVALFFLLRKRRILSALSWGMGIGFKLTPLLLLPLFWRKYKEKQKALKYWGVTGLSSLLLLAPVIWMASRNFGESLNLYFQSFEFNASVYYVFRQMGYWLKGWNTISWTGPLTALIAVGLIIWKSFHSNTSVAPRKWLSLLVWSYAVYLFCSTTVHPWYLSLLLFASIFTRYRFAVIWSMLIILSYAHYHDGLNRENYLLISLEYLVVIFAFLWEWLRNCSIVPWLMDEDTPPA